MTAIIRGGVILPPCPLRVNWSTEPTVEYRFRTSVAVSHDGIETRVARVWHPELRVTFESTHMSADLVKDAYRFLSGDGRDWTCTGSVPVRCSC